LQALFPLEVCVRFEVAIIMLYMPIVQRTIFEHADGDPVPWRPKSDGRGSVDGGKGANNMGSPPINRGDQSALDPKKKFGDCKSWPRCCPVKKKKISNRK
jgi:hypothetical protein